MKKYQIGFTDKNIIKDQSLLRHEDIKLQIKILPELQAFIPPLLGDEYAQLEENILKEGCREALLIWETTAGVALGNASPDSMFVLVDGHNRYSVCQKHALDFKIHLVQFPTIEAVRFFMIDNQLGRRNLTPEQTSYLRGLRYRTEKQGKGKYDRTLYKGQNVPYGHEEESEEQKGQNVPYESGNTSERLAERFNVSEKTIKRDADFSEGLDKLTPDFRNQILSGQIKINKALISQLADIETEPLSTLPEVIKILKKADNSENKPSAEVVKKQLSDKLNQLIQLENPSGYLLDSIIRLVKQLKSLKE
ncbi:MAG: hypothetical protein QM669_00030 [Siphonobacter sp.]